ncbi:hypothetical protein CRUP_035936 [Coryphaenoides rupestris]|nr:hypothetical protein CRUP_035936 [Coryphaenoides rupestris]
MDVCVRTPNVLRGFSGDGGGGGRGQGQGGGGGGDPHNMNMEEQEQEQLSLEEILVLYSQPINEEQAWAVCYQCCRTLAHNLRRRRRRSRRRRDADAAPSPPSPPSPPPSPSSSVGVDDGDGGGDDGGDGGGERRIEGPGDVRIQRDGTVVLRCHRDTTDVYTSAHTSLEVMESLGIMIYKALDYGLKESEERELSPPLERLIDLMTKATDDDDGRDPCPDEGYEATEEEDESEADEGLVAAHGLSSVRSYKDIITLCSSHPAQRCARALYTETRELGTFLEKIKSAKENLRKMGGGRWEAPVKDLDDLQNDDWARFWVQVMRDLRHGVKLKKVQERQYNPLPIELKKSAHEVILDFIRSRPPLNSAAARKLKPHPPRPRSLHERLLADIKAERKLRPVSPDMVRRTRLGAGKSISTPQDLFRSSDTPDAPRKLMGSTQSLANGLPGHLGGGGGALSQRKRLLRAPTLAELDSSESDEDTTQSSSSRSTSMLDDLSPESGGTGKKKVPPNSSCHPVRHPSRAKRQSSPPPHSPSRTETPTTPIPPLLPPSRQSSNSLLKADPSAKVAAAAGAQEGGEEFLYPVECLALTVEEVMHIRQVLVKAELEKFQPYKDIYTALKKGKLCFACRIKKFSFFTWAYNCQFCKRPVCSQCCKKMRLPSKPYATLPIYSLGPSAMSKDDGSAASASASASASSSASQSDKATPFGSGHNRHSLRRTVSKLSKNGSSSNSSSKEGRPQQQQQQQQPDEAELPRELTEDWATMEVCVDCKKFITEIISSSRRSLSCKAFPPKDTDTSLR